MINVLNLYCGIGGNRKNWPRGLKVTAVENHAPTAAIYKKYFPQDRMVITDAHQYLLENWKRFDFIWSSPSCLTNTRLTSVRDLTFYPDLSTYQETLFLSRVCFEKPFVVENVIPYYKPLIRPSAKIGRHLFWSNFDIPSFDFEQFPMNHLGTIEVEIKMMEWLGFPYDRSEWQGIGKRRIQLIRNCVHPEIGLYIFNHAKKNRRNTNQFI